jgi:ABC-type Na+ transport system ATPase subunit NatA
MFGKESTPMRAQACSTSTPSTSVASEIISAGSERRVAPSSCVLTSSRLRRSRVAVIDCGRIVAEGTIEDLRSREGEGLEEIFMRAVDSVNALVH